MRNLSTQGYAIAFLVAAKIGITMAVADRYGWHRDELYYLASSRHLSLGYVDYPPVTPLLARLDQALFPGSLPRPRLLPVLAGAAAHKTPPGQPPPEGGWTGPHRTTPQIT